MPDKKQITLTLTHTEALALHRAAEIGVRVIQALDLSCRTTATNNARAKLLSAAAG